MGYLLTTVLLFLIRFCAIQGECDVKTELSGSVSDSYKIWASYFPYKKCWEIQVPTNKFIHLQVLTFYTDVERCHDGYLEISVKRSDESYKYCSKESHLNPVTAMTDVEITFYLRSDQFPRKGNFQVNYEIRDLECIKQDAFHCTRNICIPRSKVCDGVQDCPSGADEVGCETEIVTDDGIEKARLKAINWLKSKWTSSWGWNENTARAVAALFLGGGAQFNGTVLEEELMAKQTELKVAVDLLRPTITMEQLSMNINGLLVTCYNPRRFHGNDLLKILRNQIDTWGNLTHPAAYLALCNANETWPSRAIEDLSDILESNATYPFLRDIQAFAVMAVSCMDNRTQILKHSENSSLGYLFKKTIKKFKEYQTAEGSFGNVHTTALITQALFSSGQKHASDWNLDATIEYLMKELNSTNVDFITTYLILPILNGKSLADIAKVNCSANPRKHGDGDLVPDVKDYLGPKIRVRYSLFVGDEIDVVHTIFLRVPENFTAFEVMQRSEIEDPKYKFQWKRVSGQMYIYRIAKISNDPEAGKFWLTYTSSSHNENYTYSTTDPDQLLLSDGDHLIMWYKTAHI